MKRLLPLALLLVLAACQSTTARLKTLYGDSLRDRLGDGPFESLDEDFLERQEERREEVRRLVKAEQLVTAEDFLYAGVILSTSSHPDDLTAAWASGLKAAELGNDLGFRVAAEAIDRVQMVSGAPQRYGTQYYYVDVLQKWRLYPVDEKTSDEERAAMGVEPMAELLTRVDALNEEVR